MWNVGFVDSKPQLANAEVSSCRMRSFHISDADIQIMSSMNLRRSSASLGSPEISYRM